MEQAGSGGLVEEDLVASDVSRRRINDEVQRRRPGRLGLGDVGRQPQMPEDTHNHRGIFDQGDQCEASAKPGTGEHVQPWGRDRYRQATVQSIHDSVDDAYARLDAIAEKLQRDGAPLTIWNCTSWTSSGSR